MTDELTELLWASMAPDVVIVRWPEHADEAQRLDRLGVAHLLLLEPGATPPDVDSCVEDWIRLPANDDDLRARLVALRRRAQRHPTTPMVDSYGQLSYRGTHIYLSPIEQRLMELLAGRFGSVVTKDELLAAWPDGGASGSLRVHVSRLRKRLRPTGLTIESRQSTGYVLREHAPSEAHA